MQRFGGPSTGSGRRNESDVAAHIALAVNGMGSFIWDIRRGVMHYDDAGLSVMGFAPGQFDGRLESLGDRMVEEELPAIQSRVERALRERTGFSLYFRVRHADGSLRWTHTQGHVISDDEGHPTRVIGIIRDASDELRAVNQTRELYRARHDVRRQADLVGELNGALAPTVTVSDVAEALTATALLVELGAASIVVGLVESGRVVVVGSNGLPEEWVRSAHLARLGEPLPLSEVVRTRRPVFLTDRDEFATRYPHLAPFLEEVPDATAAAYLPLIAHGTPIGAVGLSYNGKSRFTREERTVLTALSGTIAQALQRALLYDEEHELAAGLQTAMLPGHLPHVPGLELATRYRPARSRGEIGGDWYDAVTLPDGRIAAVVGDVQGHDVTAAAVMGQLRIALQAYAAEGHPPSTVMARTSTFLAELDTERFATCLLVLLDPRTGHTVTVRAGHLEPVLRKPDGSGTWLETPGGLPLGLAGPTAPTDYPESEAMLEPGSTLVLCTDGLIETRTKDIDQGRTELLDALGTGPVHPGPLADHLLNTMGDYTGREDDVALLLLRRVSGRPTTPSQITATIDRASPLALHAARRTLSAALRDWSMESLVDVAELLACELATNALLHTDGSVTFAARLVDRDGARALRLAVTDASSTAPRRRAATEQSASGRGLMLVEELADAWGVEPCGNGKSVWCEIPLTAS